MNPNNSRSLCHRTLNDPGPKFNTHFGHSCGTVPVHLSGQHPGRNRKALKKIDSLLNTYRDKERDHTGKPCQDNWTEGSNRYGQPTLAGTSSSPRWSWWASRTPRVCRIQGQANPEARLRGCPAPMSLEPHRHRFLSIPPLKPCLEPTPTTSPGECLHLLCFPVLVFCLDQRFSKSGLLTGSFSITWEVVKNANFSDPQIQTLHIRNSEDETQENVFLNRPLGDSDAHSSLRITGLDRHNGL